MGSVCCVAARDRTPPNRTRGENLHRGVIHSPSWSFRWNNRRHVAVEIENHSYRSSHGISRNGSLEIEREFGFHVSGGGSPLENSGAFSYQGSPIHEEVCGNPTTPPSDVSMRGNCNAELKSSTESPEIVDSSAPRLSFSVQSSSSFSTPIVDPLSSYTLSLPANSTESRQVRFSPGHQLLRQVSESQILGVKSPNNNSVSDGRQSFVRSTCSNDLTTRSQGGSSDGWSMRTFTELVASSQRERRSFDGEWLGSGRDKISGSSSRFSYSPSIDLQHCGACSKLLTERSSWSGHDLSVVAVLVCGHVFHADCLEAMTSEAERFDPCCPICIIGEKEISKMSRKALRAEAEMKSRTSKISRNRVVDSYLEGECNVLDRRKNTKQEGKFSTIEPSSSVTSSFARPFLRRHFSLGSKWSRSISENDTSRKKGFWARRRKD